MKQKNWDHENKRYIGTFYYHKMDSDVRKAFSIYYKQRERSGTIYTCNEFIYWHVNHPLRKKLRYANVARFNHDKPYSFDNIELQEAVENTKERNTRCGMPDNGKMCIAIDIEKNTLIKKFKSKREAAKYFNVSEKTVFNHCQNITTNPFKFGPSKIKSRKIKFVWA